MSKNNFTKIKRKTGRTIIIDGDIVSNHNLSLKARMLLGILLSLPDNWHFTEKGLSIAVGEGLTSVRSGLKELEKERYLYRYQNMGNGGKFGEMSYIVSEEPMEIDKINGNVRIVSTPDYVEKIDDMLPSCENQTTVQNCHTTVMRKTDNGKCVNGKQIESYIDNNIYTDNINDIDDKNCCKSTISDEELQILYSTYGKARIEKIKRRKHFRENKHKINNMYAYLTQCCLNDLQKELEKTEKQHQLDELRNSRSNVDPIPDIHDIDYESFDI